MTQRHARGTTAPPAKRQHLPVWQTPQGKQGSLGPLPTCTHSPPATLNQPLNLPAARPAPAPTAMPAMAPDDMPFVLLVVSGVKGVGGGVLRRAEGGGEGVGAEGGGVLSATGGGRGRRAGGGDSGGKDGGGEDGGGEDGGGAA